MSTYQIELEKDQEVNIIYSLCQNSPQMAHKSIVPGDHYIIVGAESLPDELFRIIPDAAWWYFREEIVKMAKVANDLCVKRTVILLRNPFMSFRYTLRYHLKKPERFLRRLARSCGDVICCFPIAIALKILAPLYSFLFVQFISLTFGVLLDGLYFLTPMRATAVYGYSSERDWLERQLLGQHPELDSPRIDEDLLHAQLALADEMIKRCLRNHSSPSCVLVRARRLISVVEDDYTGRKYVTDRFIVTLRKKLCKKEPRKERPHVEIVDVDGWEEGEEELLEEGEDPGGGTATGGSDSAGANL